ncbi:hypothetical protein [Metabacillus litoralis]|uniref:hypothetical protein n=1 Tax=Metabacillus litoralis TaxID=152268 RepID=UPI0020419F74|nr:hypothetical protein [Metabacillus litoralis]MCM3161002.1 hypothetical protein [Metabacillus litoralis]
MMYEPVLKMYRQSPELSYVWLEMIKKELIEDQACEKKICAVELAQQLLREKVTGIAE